MELIATPKVPGGMSSDKNNNHWLPQRCEMPDLSHLSDKTILNHTLNIVFRRTGPKDRQARALVTDFIRLVDQIVREYNNARQALIQFVNAPSAMGLLFLAVGHFEVCITNLRRAIRIGNRIRQYKGAPQVPRLRVLSKGVEARVDDIRHTIEHLEEKMLKGEIGSDESTILRPMSDSIELAGKGISYAELAEWIEALHTMARDLVEFRQEVA